MNQTDQMTNAHSSSDAATASAQPCQRWRRDLGSDNTLTPPPFPMVGVGCGTAGVAAAAVRVASVGAVHGWRGVVEVTAITPRLCRPGLTYVAAAAELVSRLCAMVVAQFGLAA